MLTDWIGKERSEGNINCLDPKSNRLKTKNRLNPKSQAVYV